MHPFDNASAGTKRKLILLLAVVLLLSGGIRLHALSVSQPPVATVSADHVRPPRPSLDATIVPTIPPRSIVAVIPAANAVAKISFVEDVFIPVHLDGSYFNRPPPR